MHARIPVLALLTVALVVPAVAGHPRSPQAAAAKAPPALQITASPAERQLRSWLSAFNSGDRAKYEAFLRENFPSRAARLEGDLNFLMRTGGFDILKVESRTATSVTGLVEERAWNNVARAVMEVESTAPHRITRLEVNLAPQAGRHGGSPVERDGARFPPSARRSMPRRPPAGSRAPCSSHATAR